MNIDNFENITMEKKKTRIVRKTKDRKSISYSSNR